MILSFFGFVVFASERFVLSSLALCFLMFCSPVSTVKRELVYVLLAYVFVYFASVNFCPFCLPLGVRD